MYLNYLPIMIVVLLAGCGPKSDFVKVRLDPGISKNHNLQNDFFSLKQLSSPRCLQKVFAGYSERTEGGGFTGIETVFASDQMASVPTDAQSFIDTANIGVPEPIYLTLPRNKSIRVGMMGIFFASSSVVNGYCTQAQYTSSSDAFPFIASTQSFVVEDQDTVPIALQMIRATETPNPSGNNQFHQITPIPTPTPAGCPVGGCTISFTYGGNENNSSGVTIVGLQGSLAPFSITLPHMYPIQTKVVTTSGTFYGSICEQDDGTGHPTNPSGSLSYVSPSDHTLNGGNCTLFPGH